MTNRRWCRSCCLCPSFVEGDVDRLWEFVLLLLQLFPGCSSMCAARLLGSGSRMSVDPQAPGLLAGSGICPFVGHCLGAVIEWLFLKLSSVRVVGCNLFVSLELCGYETRCRFRSVQPVLRVLRMGEMWISSPFSRNSFLGSLVPR